MTKLLVLLCFISLSRPAAAIVKCELNGKITYSDTGCPESAVKPLPLRAEPAPADMQAARQRARQDKLDLAEIEKQQRIDEARERKAQQLLNRTQAGRKKACDALALQVKWREEDAAHATPKASAKARRTAKRAIEKYELRCRRL